MAGTDGCSRVDQRATWWVLQTVPWVTELELVFVDLASRATLDFTCGPGTVCIADGHSVWAQRNRTGYKHRGSGVSSCTGHFPCSNSLPLWHLHGNGNLCMCVCK